MLMKLFLKPLLFGLLVWLVPFVVAFAIFPLRESHRALFESIMPVVVTAITVLLAVLYFRRVRANSVRVGLGLGVLWYAISVGIDLPLMLSPPIEMSVGEYFADVGLTYLIIPLATIGVGCGHAMRPKEDAE